MPVGSIGVANFFGPTEEISRVARSGHQSFTELLQIFYSLGPIKTQR